MQPGGGDHGGRGTRRSVPARCVWPPRRGGRPISFSLNHAERGSKQSEGVGKSLPKNGKHAGMNKSDRTNHSSLSVGRWNFIPPATSDQNHIPMRTAYKSASTVADGVRLRTFQSLWDDILAACKLEHNPESQTASNKLLLTKKRRMKSNAF